MRLAAGLLLSVAVLLCNGCVVVAATVASAAAITATSVKTATKVTTATVATTGGRSNWVVPPGKRARDTITGDLDRCIVVTGFLGGNSNSLTGDFSFGVQGLLLERGKVVKHLSEMNVSGNIGELLSSFAEAADDTWTWSGVRSPSLLFENVQFSGS